MATKTAMPQCWAELIASRLHKRECAGQIASIKQACDEGCSKKDFVECSKCYELAVDRLRMRYCASDSQEWFTDRKAFVQELEGLFAEVKRRKRSLQSVEARIEAEKEAWYRLMLRRHPDFLALAEQGSRSSELRKMLDDPDTSRQNIVDRVWEGFGKSHNWESDVDSFAEKVSAVGSDSAARKEVYSNGIFVDTVKGGADKYFAEYEHHEDISSPDTLLEVVIGKVADDIRQSRSSQPERDNHQKRLDDLRRAKTAFEQNKVRAKNRARNAPVAGEVLYELPPCLVCQKAVDTTKVLSCTVCQMVTQIGGDGNLTVYCSEECYEKGHAEHVEKNHDCQAGEDCWQLFDEDIDMDDGESQTVACQTCLDAKKITLYCSPKCAAKNVSRHMGEAHQGIDLKDTVVPLQEVVTTTLEKENPRMVFKAI